MRINLGTVSVDDFYRRAIWWNSERLSWPDGKDPRQCPMAPRAKCRQFIFDHGWGFLEMDVAHQYQQAIDFFEEIA